MGVVGEQLRETGGAFRDVFRNRGLRRVNLALAGSVIGDWAYAIAVSIWAYQQGGATALGVFGVARYVTLSLVGPVLSTFADRYSKRAVMIAADLSRVALVVVGAIAIEADAPALVVYGVALVTSRPRDGVPPGPGRAAAVAWPTTRASSPAPTSSPRRSRASGSSSVPRSARCCCRWPTSPSSTASTPSRSRGRRSC